MNCLTLVHLPHLPHLWSIRSVSPSTLTQQQPLSIKTTPMSMPQNSKPVTSLRLLRCKGCFTCRKRKKKCDERKPICLACDRNSLICVFPDSDHLLGNTQPQPAPSFVQSSILIRLHPQPTLSVPLLLQRRPGSKFLYDHYLHRTARSISVLPSSSNPFVNILVPIATEFEPALHAILALSGIHCGTESCNTAAALAAHEHCVLGLRALKFELTKFAAGNTDSAFGILVTILVFCLIEIIRGDEQGSAFHHLNAARCLLSGPLHRNIVTGAVNHTVLAFVTELYAYVLSLSASSTVDGPDASFLRHSDDVFLLISGKPTPVYGTLFGCARDLFRLIPAVVFESTKRTWTTETGNLRHQVRSWTPDSSFSERHAVGGKLYQLAMLMLIERTESEQSLVTSFVELLQTLPVDAEVVSILLWPLAIAGFRARQSEHRDVITSYLSDMHTHYGFGNIRQTLELLESVWAGVTVPEADSISAAMSKHGLIFHLG
ncbi:C6 zinc finger domain protein [Podospora fimiseda]|uniref:C6 zinc finger domain protein n=1 Tax=Podospora fimiseda TaxID=252190 RepID=A0AAN7BLN2_9PEZI|nr:C6 zinc finger domain protein [Podospora fimiseda]